MTEVTNEEMEEWGIIGEMDGWSGKRKKNKWIMTINEWLVLTPAGISDHPGPHQLESLDHPHTHLVPIVEDTFII